MERYFQIGKVNLKISLLPHLVIAILFLCLSPTLMSLENLDAIQSAQVLEIYVALIGIILLTPIFLPEQNKDIRDLMESKYTSIISVYLLRIIEAMVAMLLLIAVFVAIMINNNCNFDAMKYFVGIFLEALFLGGFGMIAYSIFDNIAIGYMLPMCYYVASMVTGSKYLKKMYLFSMMKESFDEKWFIGIVGIGFILVAILIKYIVGKRS